MKVQVEFYQGGKTWKEVVIANNVQHAKKIAEARNPGIHIVGLNPVAGQVRFFYHPYAVDLKIASFF